MKLLLIEDEDFIRDLYKRQLELAGMPTDAFGLGNDGLNAAHQTPTAYDLVLLDIMLPDTNGLQILKDLKQNNATKQIPVILLTNLSQDMLIKEGFELGAEGYLVKAAYTPAQIVQEVKNILAKKQAQPVSPQSPQVAPSQTPVTPAAQPNPVTAPSPSAPAPTPTEPLATTPAVPAPDPMTASPAPSMPSSTPTTPDLQSATPPAPADPMMPSTPPTAPDMGTLTPAAQETSSSAPTAPIDPATPPATPEAPISSTPTPSTDSNNSH